MTRRLFVALLLTVVLLPASGCCVLGHLGCGGGNCGMDGGCCTGFFQADIACGGPCGDCGAAPCDCVAAPCEDGGPAACDDGGAACAAPCDAPCGDSCGGFGSCFPLLGHLLGALAHGCHGHGCGEVYWNEFYNDPPDVCEPCDGYGHWTGSMGLYRAPYRNGPYGAGGNVPHLAAASEMPVDDYQPLVEAALDLPPAAAPDHVPVYSTRRPCPPATHWR